MASFCIAVGFNIKKKSLQDYLTGTRTFNWFIIGFAIFSTNIGSEHVVGLAESGYSDGFNRANIEIMALLPLTLLGWLIAPYLIRRNITTIPEYIERRYGRATKWIVVSISFFAYITTKISISLFAGAYLVKNLLGIDYYTTSLVLLILAGLYALIGGVRGVMINGVFQGVLILLSGVIITFYCLSDIGGWDVLESNTAAHKMEIFYKEGNNTLQIIMYTIVMLFSGIWYWCSDQYIVQRVMGAKSITHATRGTMLAGVLKLSLLFFFILPGLVAAYEFPGIEPSQAYAKLLTAHIPEGLRGIIVVGVMAALMSSLSATFNTISTVFTLDVYRRLYPTATEFQLVNVGQIAIIAFMIFAIVWVPFVPLVSKDIFHYLRVLQFQLGLPLAVLVVIGMLWKRPKESAALTVIILGFALGLFYTLLPKGIGEKGSIIHYISHMDVYVYYFNVIVISLITFVTIGVLSNKTDVSTVDENLSGAAFRWTFGIRLNVIITVLVNLGLVYIWYIFK